VAKSLADRLVAFAAMQSSVAAPTNSQDLNRAAAIGALDAAVRQSVSRAMHSDAPLPIGADREEVKQVAAPTGRVVGKVRFYNQDRKFGFISDRDNNDYFFNANHFRGAAPTQGTSVEFDVQQGAKGPVARNIVIKEIA
jgi:cold shock CspA family protein